MDLDFTTSEWANLATALAVIVAVTFGIVQVLQGHRKRRDATTFAFISSFQSERFLESLRLVLRLPDHASHADVVKANGVRAAADELSNLFEGMGYMVHERLVPLRVVDDLVGGGVRMSHAKLQDYLAVLRRERSPTYYEWFTWLNDQLLKRGRQDRSVPAQVKFADWEP